MQLREAGVSYEKIAEAVGYRDRSGAYKAVMAGLEAAPQESATNLRRLELRRLDKLSLQLWPQAVAKPPDLPALESFLRVMKRRAALTGLDKNSAKGANDDVPKVAIDWDDLYDRQEKRRVNAVEELLATKVKALSKQSGGQVNLPPNTNGTCHG
jgi:hypothetical protein